ncbi:hypothetical protein [Thiolapillus brandeum]|uniref:Uncharacterized protein n=1 Tax=Thiolapillus brandeum TaxID=1076588 RepID=A0A7U6GGR0_9GAMM|nr:hypothetical protein [Thiolapillus brandeum]BAO43332.1 hypothetical protein TBH_C0386 [Thiolapillus brandeum]
MKIIVYNFNNQYALSRKQVEAIKAAMPKEFFLPVSEFHLTHTRVGAEVFEYSAKEKIVYFAFPVKEKTQESTSAAIDELLVGLARIKSPTRWEYPLGERERASHEEFVKGWKVRCLDAATK